MYYRVNVPCALMYFIISALWLHYHTHVIGNELLYLIIRSTWCSIANKLASYFP